MSNRADRMAPEEARRFGAWLRKALKARQITQNEFADMAGIGPACLSYIVQGHTDPRISTVIRILRALGLRMVFTAIPKTGGGKAPERTEQ